MSDNMGVSTPQLVPRPAYGGIAITIALGLVYIVAIGIFVPADDRFAWLPVGAGTCLLTSFVVQLWMGRAKGFIIRVASGALGALAVMGIVSLGLALAAIAP